jgi:DNA replication protein DnaC
MENWQEVPNTLQIQSDDVLRRYISAVAKTKFWPPNAPPEQTHYLGYQGDDPDLMMRLFKIYIELFYPDFVLNDDNMRAAEYMAMIAAGKAEKRGLLLHGPVGTGKTLLLFIWTDFRQKILTTVRKDKIYKKEVGAKFCLLSSGELIRLFTEHGESRFTFLNDRFGDILLLDDIGINTEGNYFGAKTNVLAELIYNRYNKFKFDSEMEIYATTNLISKQLSDVIGERAFSRLVEMAEWNAGSITGSDRRRSSNPVKEWPMIQKGEVKKPPEKQYNPILPGDTRYVPSWEGIDKIEF